MDSNVFVGLSLHEFIGVSPSEMNFGRDIRFPLDLLKSCPVLEESLEVQDYVFKLRKILEDIHSFVRRQLENKSLNVKC